MIFSVFCRFASESSRFSLLISLVCSWTMFAKFVNSFFVVSTVLIKESCCWRNILKKRVIPVNLRFRILVFLLKLWNQILIRRGCLSWTVKAQETALFLIKLDWSGLYTYFSRVISLFFTGYQPNTKLTRRMGSDKSSLPEALLHFCHRRTLVSSTARVIMQELWEWTVSLLFFFLLLFLWCSSTIDHGYWFGIKEVLKYCFGNKIKNFNGIQLSYLSGLKLLDIGQIDQKWW